MYSFAGTASFDNSYKRLAKNNNPLVERIDKTLLFMRINPFDQKLKTHHVTAPPFGLCWSSSVTGDVRILWDLSKKEKKTINLYKVGRHSGGSKVYK